MTRPCQTRLLHLVTYESGMTMQETLVGMRQKEEIPDQLLLLEHPPVITLGRGGKASNLMASEETLRRQGVRYFETTRGGDITYHGPGQVVGYPILHLGEGRRDIRKYVTSLEEVLIRTVAGFGVEATRSEVNRGIWVGRKKLAAIGVRVARWVTSHGFALNVRPDLRHFELIVPCGLQGLGVTSLEEIVGQPVSQEAVSRALVRHFGEVFDREMIILPPRLLIIKVVVHDGSRVLLLHRKPSAGDFWQPLTGTIEAGETAHEAADRELMEETGHPGPTVPMNLMQSFIIESKYMTRRFPPPIFTDEVVFSARLNPDLPISVDQEDHDGFGWFTFLEAYEKIRWSDDREAIERLEKEVSRASVPRPAGDQTP